MTDCAHVLAPWSGAECTLCGLTVVDDSNTTEGPDVVAPGPSCPTGSRTADGRNDEYSASAREARAMTARNAVLLPGSYGMVQDAAVLALLVHRAPSIVWACYHAINRLRDDGEVTQVAIAAALRLPKQRVHEAVSRLKDWELVDEDDDGYKCVKLPPESLRQTGDKVTRSRDSQPNTSNAIPLPRVTRSSYSESRDRVTRTIYRDIETRDSVDSAAAAAESSGAADAPPALPDLSTKKGRDAHYQKPGRNRSAPKSYPAAFDAFWSAVKWAGGKASAYVEWRALVVDGVDPDAILAAAQRYGQSDDVRGGFVRNCPKWLREGDLERWMLQAKPAQPKPSGAATDVVAWWVSLRINDRNRIAGECIQRSNGEAWDDYTAREWYRRQPADVRAELAKVVE